DPATTGNADTADLPEGYDGDPRLLGIDLNECEKAHNASPRLALDRPRFDKVRDIIGAAAMTGGENLRPFGAFVCESVVFLVDGRFEFGRDVRDPAGAKAAVICCVHDEYDENVDLAAFDIDSGAVAIWRGRVGMLGEYWLAAATFDEPLIVHETALDWLRAGREGLYVIDLGRAGRLLAGRSIAVKDVAFGAALRAALRLEPVILVSEEAP
ncbi:MAG: hypothetical protein WBD95_18850, partial [Xanthobacteraceae bacterium]